ncbi:MAG: hypothetical protein GKR88_06595 [Flavobacteriaceae bacterium]|nr:MAG: hypothetical protein GKR88_06595 [Flavobacteriaceae bacterium]
MKLFIRTLLITLVSYSLNGQQKKNTLSVQEQFDQVYRTSVSYQEFKVVRKVRYQELKNIVQDSMNKLKIAIGEKNDTISLQKSSISESKKIIASLTNDLNLIRAKKKRISFLGISMNTSLYVLLMSFVIIVLLSSSAYFIYKFKSSNVYTKEAKKNLQELEGEFADYKKKSLLNEQKLRRKFQDEINKQRNS